MFKLFRTKPQSWDDVDYGLDVFPFPPVSPVDTNSEFQELTLSESYEVILERLDRIDAKIDKLLEGK